MKSCKKISMPAIFPVAAHTDNVGQGTIFVAIKGQSYDGILYIPQAITKGASRIVIQHDAVIPKDIELLLTMHAIPLTRVENSRKALAELSAQVAGYPAKQLKILGVTGTKGKTTSVYILETLLKKLGYSVARLSTVSNAIHGCEVPAHLTTAQPDYLQQFFVLCVAEKIDYVIMEIAAQATTFNRIETVELDGLIFTNLDREHAELYPTMEEYFAAKSTIFSHLKKDAPASINGDDLYGQRILGQQKNSYGFSLQKSLEQYVSVTYEDGKLHMLVDNKEHQLRYTGIPGIFNGYNLAAVVLLLLKLGLPLESIEDTSIDFPKIPGRLEQYQLPNGASAYIDYAHTPGSFKSLLSVVRTWTNHVIVVFGAGGGKDHLKRPLMGSIAAEYADVVIITTDNPRQEDPQTIVADILSGIDNKKSVLVELDRSRAIELAYQHSKKDSIIMLLGKGPDEYQIVGTTKIPFSEKGILNSFVK